MEHRDRFGSFLNPPVYNVRGMIYTLRGVIMPFPGALKKTTQKCKKALVAFACLCAVLLLVMAILLSYQAPYGLPQQKEILESVGMPLAEVAVQLDVPVEQIQQVEPGLYRIPAGCEYKGITFDILLYFEEHEGLLRNYGYEARYDANTTKAAKDIAAITKLMAVDKIVLADETVLETTRKQLKTHLTEVGGIAVDITLNSTVHSATALSEYLAYLEEADYYEGRIGEYLIKNALYYEDLHVAYDSKEGDMVIKLWCTVETDRAKDY